MGHQIQRDNKWFGNAEKANQFEVDKLTEDIKAIHERQQDQSTAIELILHALKKADVVNMANIDGWFDRLELRKIQEAEDEVFEHTSEYITAMRKYRNTADSIATKHGVSAADSNLDEIHTAEFKPNRHVRYFI